MPTSNTMKQHPDIKIGIIGPVALIEATKQALQSFPNFDPIFITAESKKSIILSMTSMIDEVEVFLVTEYFLYESVKRDIPNNVPVHHVPLMGTGLYRSLSLLKSKH